LKLLIGGSPSKFFHLREFGEELTKLGIQYKLVVDSDISDGFPSRKIKNWFHSSKNFEKLIDDFKPDFVLIDRLRHFGLDTIKSKLPLLVHLRGDFWAEADWARTTIYKPPHKRLALLQWEKIAHQCFNNTSMILPICQHLEKVVKQHYPNKKTHVLYQGIDSSHWYPSNEMKLKHPSVGLVQSAIIWGKTKEMLVLSKVLESMPNVTFYWAGDGPFRNDVLKILGKYENFKWLGALDYPDKVRSFLSEIDVYSLVSGIDMSPLTLLEAQLMKKPVVASKVGGIPELMEDNVTGFLVEKGDHTTWIEKLSFLLQNKNEAEQMGSLGRDFVIKNFSWNKIAKEFVKSLDKIK